MRNIKFRVWDTEENKFREMGFMINQYGSLMQYGEFEKMKKISKDRYKIMQYTGLKDKEGKEIYEGDIVKFKTMIGSEQTGVVVLHQGEYCAEIKRKNHSSYYRLYEFYEDNENIKIVGNKYENPELKGGE